MRHPALVVSRISTALMALALCAVGATASAATVTLSVADGAMISDTVVVTARVVGFEISGVRKVEFRVNGQVRGEDSSTPYTLEWDTLGDAEGRHTLEAIATDMQGATARASVSVTIDNELGNGADHHARLALEALRAGDAETAARRARRAIKADPANLTAARAMSAIYRASRDYTQAIAVLEQATIPEDDTVARRELAELYVLRGDAGQTAESMLQGMQAAWDQHRKYLEARIASLPADASPVKKGDAAYSARRWLDAIKSYQAAGDPATMDIRAANRLLLAYARAGRARDCDLLLRTLNREKRVDNVTRAIEGFYLLQSYKPFEARQAVQAGVENRALPSLVVAACCDLILKERKRAADEIAEAAAIAPGLPAVLYLQTYVTTEPLDVRRQFVMAFAADPGNTVPIVRKAYDTLATNRPTRFQEAEALLEFARKVDPDCPEALRATAALLMLQKRPEEAQPVLEKLLAIEKDAPDILVGQAMNLSLLDQSKGITDLLNRAMKIDEERWNDVYVPKPVDYVNRLMRYRVIPLLDPQMLYPED